VLRALKAHRVLRVLKALKALKVHKVLLVHKALRAIKEELVDRADGENQSQGFIGKPAMA
jgi:hypothetical protein